MNWKRILRWALVVLFVAASVWSALVDSSVKAVAPINRRIDSLSSEVGRQRSNDSLVIQKVNAALLLMGGAASKGASK